MSSFQIYIIKRNNNSPRDIKELSGWVSNQIESTPVECQDDRSILCTPLRDCYEQLLERYPALNGRDATDDDELIDKAFDYYLLEKPCVRDPRSPVPLTLAVQNSLTL